MYLRWSREPLPSLLLGLSLAPSNHSGGWLIPLQRHCLVPNLPQLIELFMTHLGEFVAVILIIIRNEHSPGIFDSGVLCLSE